MTLGASFHSCILLGPTGIVRAPLCRHRSPISHLLRSSVQSRNGFRAELTAGTRRAACDSKREPRPSVLLEGARSEVSGTLISNCFCVEQCALECFGCCDVWLRHAIANGENQWAARLCLKRRCCRVYDAAEHDAYPPEIMQNLYEQDCMQNLILNHMHKGTIQMMSRTGAVPAVRPKGRSARAPGRPLAK